MDLRSSRSRSRTPFVVLTRLEEENMANSMKQKTIERRTYTTRQKTIECLSTKDEVLIDEVKQREGTLRDRRRHKTSDYSSEEEHTENGSFKSALQVYKEAGEYWNKYPKTDYTYSMNSKDRMEIAPGVPCMPNMSRKSLRRSMEPTSLESASETTSRQSASEITSNNVVRKTLNFDETDELTTTEKYSAGSYNTAGYNSAGYNTADYNSAGYNSARYNSTGYNTARHNSAASKTAAYNTSYNSAATSYSSAVYRRISTVITRIYQSITALFLAVYTAAETSVLWTARTYYQTVSRLFLFDTWLMQKSSAPAAAQSTRKYGALIAIMFLPLLLFAGWTLWSNINEIIQTRRQHQEITPFPAGIPTNPAENPGKPGFFAGNPGIPAENPAATQFFDINALLSHPQFEQIINNHLSEKIAKLEMDLTSIKAGINALNSGLRGELSLLKTEKCCRRQYYYLMGGGKKSYIDEVELNRRLNQLKIELTEKISRFEGEGIDRGGTDGIRIAGSRIDGIKIDGTGVSDSHIRRIIQETLAIYDADKTGLVDYALESSGGQIISTRCTENYHSRTAVVSILGVPLWYPSNTPRVVITPGVTPGECWAFQNFPGFVVVQLSAMIRLSAVSLEHIPESLAPGGARDSAPRRFSVWGLTGENDRDPWSFGTFEYRLEGPPLQYFDVGGGEQAPAFNMVELRVESNHGNINYTCLYRFRVHGNQ